MCGIAGWIDWDKNLTEYTEIVKKMGDSLNHRGPDAQGQWISNHIGFAHTRLIVIDPIGGAQPMLRKYGENEYVIIYNGELYNTRELKEELILRGHKFTSHSDTEVLLESYIEWKENCVDYLNGIYAFGIWDSSKQQVFLARDRLGVKPLFYLEKYNQLLFGSEIKAILAHPDIKAKISEEGLCEVFGLGPSRTPGQGVFDGISELRPGHYMIFNKKGVSIKQYWHLESKPHEGNLENTIEKVKELVTNAIKIQLVSDVPLCTFLSGGLDSSIISAIASKEYKKTGRKLNTYSVDFIGNDKHFKATKTQPDADIPWIKKMVNNIDSIHHYIMIGNSKLLKSLDKAVLARDLPGMADVDSSLYLFSKEIKKGATVGISGECADEIFGGYPWFYQNEYLLSNNFPWLRSLDERKKILSPALKEKILIKEYVQTRYEQSIIEVPLLDGENVEQRKVREQFYLNMNWFMANLLERKDRMSMAVGLEVRVPFADHRLVEYLWNVPWEVKYLDKREKGLLRKAMKDLLPKEIVERRKSPYPKTHDPKFSDEVCRKLLSIINDNTSPILNLIDCNYIKELIANGGISFKEPWFGQLMTGPQFLAYLIQVNTWLRHYKIVIDV
ncbi:MAG: asparagine synthase (glutamine-hydrolyzing) [Vulcanibacillus sp.]